MSTVALDDLEAQIRATQKARRRKVIVTVVVISIGVHLLLGTGAAVWVVARYLTSPPAVFIAPKKEVIIPAEDRDHRLTIAEFDGAAAKASFTDKMASIRPAPFSLPDLPKVPVDQMLALDPAQMMTQQVAALTGTGGIGNGTGNGLGGRNGQAVAGMEFFGIKDQATSVVIMIDVSDSMFTRTGDAEGRKLVREGTAQSFQKVRDAAIDLIRKLGPNTRFDVVRWGGGAHAWQPELVAATEANKTAGIEHVQTQVNMKTARPKGGRPGGTRHDYALEEAFLLKPEVIYMLTDGNATEAKKGAGLSVIPPEQIWKAAEAGQKTLEKPARLHVIYYLTGAEKPEEEKMLRILASRNQGKFKKVKAEIADPKKSS